jgi:hypothetical protein
MLGKLGRQLYPITIAFIKMGSQDMLILKMFKVQNINSINDMYKDKQHWLPRLSDYNDCNITY